MCFLSLFTVSHICIFFCFSKADLTVATYLLHQSVDLCLRHFSPLLSFASSSYFFLSLLSFLFSVVLGLFVILNRMHCKHKNNIKCDINQRSGSVACICMKQIRASNIYANKSNPSNKKKKPQYQRRLECKKKK